ncbi:MAG: hypothetical protein ACOC1X_02785 [Promethearchaeota archaeon]
MKSILELEKSGNKSHKIKNAHKCPACAETINISISSKLLSQIEKENKFPYTHLHIHGEPLHAMLCYIDSDLRVRSIKIIESLEIQK